jgi:predicted peptidase
MKTAWLRAVVGLLLVCSFAYSEQDMRHGKQEAKTLNKKVGSRVKLNYLLFLPEGYQKRGKERYPLIFFLHGIGERGSDPWKVKVHGPPKVAEKMSNFPFIVVSPQCPAGEWWSTDALIVLLDDVMGRYKVDPTRVYLTGLSMGGFGAWSLALEFPERFAAVAPICGGGNPLYVHSYDAARKAAIQAVPFWAFHGDADKSVPVEESTRMVDALKKFGCDAKLTIYPGVGHDSWTQTYSNPELYRWLLQHERKASR